jgi:ABC-type transport system involved in multi-copper enzyme maturation permease subunit
VRTLVVADLRARWRSLTGLGVGALLVLLLLTGTYSGLGGREGVTRTLGSGNGAKLMAALSGSESTNIAVPSSFLGFCFAHPLFLALGITVAISAGVAAVAADVETGRAELLYTTPVSRTAILFARVAGWAIAQVAVLGCAVVGALLGSRFSTELSDVSPLVPLRLVVQFGSLSFFFAAAAFAVSARARTRGGALAVSVGVAAASYAANLVALLVDPLRFLRHVTPFGYYDTSAAAQHVQWLQAATLCLAAVLLLILARTFLETRDLT